MFGVLEPAHSFNITETTCPYLSSIKEFCVTFLEKSTHIHTSLYSAGCPSFLRSFFLRSFLSFYLSLLSSLYKFSVPFGLQSIQFMSEIIFFSEIVES